MKWIKETKGKRQAAIGAVFLVVFLSLVVDYRITCNNGNQRTLINP